MIAIIAGTGALPLEACNSLMQKNKSFFVISLFPEDNLTQLQHVTNNQIDIVAQSAYRPGLVLDLLKKRNTDQVLLIGKVDKRAILKKVTIDWLGVKLLASLLYKSDIAIQEKILSLLASHNIEVLKQDSVLDSLLIKPGIITGSLSQELEKDVALGIKLAKEISALDIGQTVIIKDSMVIAVEAIEGTDECIQRGIQLGKKDIIICKAAQPKQNKKYDLPTLGPATLDSLQAGQVKIIAWDAQHTLIAQQAAFIKKAQSLGITLISM